MKTLTITNKMTIDEQETRARINRVIDRCGNEDKLKNWLLNQVTGTIDLDGTVLVYPNMSYDEALNYFNEVTK